MHKIIKTHYRLIILATVVVFITNILYVSQATPLKGIDLTPLGVSLCCIILFYGMYAKGLFFITPINNASVLNKLDELFVIVNKRNQILYVNKQVEDFYQIDVVNLHKIVVEDLIFCNYVSKESPENDTKIQQTLSLVLENNDRIQEAKEKLLSLTTNNIMPSFVLEYTNDERKEIFIEWSFHVDGVIKYIKGKNISEKIFSEKLIKQNYERLMQTTQHSGIIVWEVDTKGLYTYISTNVEDILGYTSEELVGKRFFYDISHEEDKVENKNFGRTIIKSQKKLSNFENRIKTKSGSFIWVLSNGTPLFDNVGKCVGFRGTDYDITERKRQQQENEELQLRIQQQEKMYSDIIAEKNKSDIDDLLYDIKKLRLKVKNKSLDRDLNDVIKNYEHKSNFHTIEKFNENFNKLHPDFYKKLLQLNSTLTNRELQICGMLKLNMSTKQIATIFSIQPSSVDIYRHRIRLKLALDSLNIQLTSFLLSI